MPSSYNPPPNPPAQWVHSGSGQSTGSATFSDVTGASITIRLPYAGYTLCQSDISWSAPTDGPTAAFRLVVGSQNGDETTDNASGTEIGSLGINLLSSSLLPAGSYVCKLQFRKAAGGGTVVMNHCDLWAISTILS